MSGHVAKDEIALLMPERLAHYFKDDPEYIGASSDNSRGLFAAIGSVVKWVIEIPRRRAVLDELASLSDHELSDIGLSRTDLTHVFDRHFVVERNAERDYLASRRPVTV